MVILNRLGEVGVGNEMESKDLILRPHNLKEDKLTVLINGNTLEIHEDIYAFLKTRNIKSALGLISLLIATPSALIKARVLSEEDRNIFLKNTFKELKTIFPPETFNTTPIPRAYGALKPTSDMYSKHLCDKCIELAVWMYAPSTKEPRDIFFCDEHVSRGCSCNIDPNTAKEDMDEKGRLYPCCEYLYNDKGFDYGESN